MPLRLAFMGTPEFAVPVLAELLAAGHNVVAVYCQPPRPAGRGQDLRYSPVYDFAASQGLTIRTPARLRDPAEQAAFRDLQLDAAVVVAYGLLLPAEILAAPRHGCLNLHPSALPRWRGAAPLQRAVMAGDRETAVMIMRMDEGLDTGPVCLSETVEIGPDVTTGELHDQLARRGASLMLKALAALESGGLACQPQAELGVTYAAKIDKAEAHIDWSAPADDVHNRIRGLSPFPGAWTEWPIERGSERGSERIKVLRSTMAEGAGAPGTVLDAALTIACGTGALRLVQVQRAGKKPMSADEFGRGFVVRPGSVLAST